MHNERSMFGRTHASVLLGLLACASLSTMGCQNQRDTVNRVQPDYLDKNDLIPNQYAALSTTDQVPTQITPQLLAKEPVFYTQNTLIAKPSTTGFTGLTSYSAADKIRWEVTENSLVARQAYEFVKNAPGGAAGIGQAPQTGDVIGIFRITSHFDIRREYNTTTGEELNVVGENTTDRPWYQRRYMHVDWSQNLVTGYNSIFMEQEWNNQLQAEPIPVFVNTPNDPNAPVFEYTGDKENRKLVYFDIVNQMVLHPETAYYSYSEHPGSTTSYQAMPLCNLGEGETACAPAQVTMRLAFRRVDPTRDYEPASLTESLPDQNGNVQQLPHLNMERFGFFDVKRLGWDTAQKATLDTQRIHLAARHNLWVHHHALVYGAATATLCNADADCGDPSLVCAIGDQLADPTHRGVCSTLGYHHVANDRACSTDDDCRQYSDTGGVSRTATCDTAAKLCGEHTIRCSSDSDCASVGARSTCDLAIGYTRADNRGLCLMPFKQRQVRPIAYHESINYPEYMQPVTAQIAKEWNSAFVEAVTSARRHECELSSNIDPSTTEPASNPCNDPKIVGLDPALGADARFPFVACHSPVWGTAVGAGQRSQADVDAAHASGWDLPACGPQGTSARLGDLRYSMIGAITDQDAQGYWGLANIAADPETGEMVAGRGAVWQTITDYYATQLVEYVKLLNDDLQTNDVVNGGDLVASMKLMGTGQTPSQAIFDAPFRTSGLAALSGVGQGIERLRMPNAGWWTPDQALLAHRGTPGALDAVQQRLLDGGMLGDGTNAGTQRLNRLAGTSIESRLMNTQQARLAEGPVPDDAVTFPSTLDQASPMRGQSPALRRAIDAIKSRVAAFQCGKEASFNDDLLMGLAQRFAKGAPISMADPDDAPVAFGRDWDFRAGGTIDYALLQQYAAQFIHHGVLAHELGHSLGQRHNFTASADSINYFDNYWKVRGQGHSKGIRPRYEYLADPSDGKYYSQQEIDGRVDEWSYSSVMDYKGLNEDAHGIGRYDYAFIKNGYVGLVEAFKTVADKSGALSYAITSAGSGQSTALDFRKFPATLSGMHYSQVPALFGTNAAGLPNIGTDNRYDVFLSETTAEPVAGWGAPPISNTTTDGHVLVPYRFDSDERAGLVWQDQRYDAGADAYESLHYVGSHLIDYYFMNSYARLRTGFSVKKYVSRMWSRYVEQFRQTTQIEAFDLLRWQDLLGDAPSFQAYLHDPKLFGGYLNQAAMNLSADAMTAILTMPEVGDHTVQPQLDGSSLFTVAQGTAPGQSKVTVPVNDGRAFESSWRNDVGFFWYDMLDRAGAYYDKVMMLQALSDPQLLLLARDTPTDIRQFQLSFYTMFPDQMTRLFGGILSEDTNDFAPIVSIAESTAAKKAVIVRPHVATLNAAPADRGRVIDATHVAIDPQNHFTMQLWAAVLTTSMFPATYDQRYMDSARLWVDGSTEAVDVADPATNTVSFTDPWSHLTYRALRMGCGPGERGVAVGCSSSPHPGGGAPEAGVAARMLKHVQDLDALRLAAADPVKASQIEQQEHRYLDLLSVMRDLTKSFGQGQSQLP